MRLSVLSSGSSGNCFYLENDKGGILIDAGVSCKRIVDSMAVNGFNPVNVKGMFITHEHSDHIRGADVFARKFNVPIYLTKKTLKNAFICSDETLINEIKNDEMVNVCGMEVQAFSKQHDTDDPVSYSIYDRKRISVITDVGKACKNVREFVSDSDILCMEANHDLGMLEHGPYPFPIKKRISSDKGHLSNMHSALCVLEYGNKKMSDIILSHLSRTNNTPLAALETFSKILKERKDLNPNIGISYKEKPTNVFEI